MQTVTAITVAAAGLLFSLSVALLVEELIFGALFRVFFGAKHGKQAAALR